MSPSIRRLLTIEGAARACGIDAYSAHIRWFVWFVVACSGLIAATLLGLWALSGFGALGIGGHGLVALILGIVFTSALAIALMALSFYSDRSGTDRAGRD